MAVADEPSGSSAGRPARPQGIPINDELIKLGFDSENPFFEIHAEDIDFGITEVQRALFASTYQQPVTLPLLLRQISDSASERFPMLVTCAGSLFEPQEVDQVGKPVGCYNHPDWLTHGHLIKSALDSYPETIWVVAKLTMDAADQEKIELMEVQLIRAMQSPWG